MVELPEDVALSVVIEVSVVAKVSVVVELSMVVDVSVVVVGVSRFFLSVPKALQTSALQATLIDSRQNIRRVTPSVATK